MLTEPTEIAGYRLPAGTIVAANATLAHDDRDSHDAPAEFRPERFIGRQPPLGTWIPFGGGVRRCLGAGFALKEITAVLRAVRTRCDLHPADPAPESPRARNVTLVPSRGAHVVVTPRER